MQTSAGRRSDLIISRLVAFALHACPPEYRRQYGGQILADLEDDSSRQFQVVFEIIESGIQMRIDSFVRDGAFAMRRLRKNPLFVAIVIITFALGIGANVAVFSVLDAVLLRPLPYPSPERLVALSIYDGRTKRGGGALSVPDFGDLRSASTLLADIGVETPSQGTITGNGKPRTIVGFDMTPGFLQALGMRAQLGRLLNASDERKGVHSILISDKLWHERFGGGLSALGQALSLDGVPYKVVGVTEPAAVVPEISSSQLRKFDFIDAQPDTAPANQRGARYLSGLAVLKPGVSVARGNAELAIISQRLQHRFPRQDSPVTFQAESLTTVILGNVSAALWTIFGAVFGILLITCANVANLILANASSRDREFALRSALGASVSRIAGQLFIETGLLAVAGGAIGICLAYWSLRVMIDTKLLNLPRIGDVHIDGWVLLYALGAVLFATLLAGFWPVLALRSQDLSLTLKSAGRGGDASTSNRMRSILVVSEVSIALALVVLSVLMVRSFVELTHVDLGIHGAGLVTSDIAALPNSRYTALAPRRAFAEKLLIGIRAIPGVTSAATSVSYPLSDVNVGFTIGVVGRTFPLGEEPSFNFNSVSSQYFTTLGIPILRGREFTDADTAGSAPVAIVNEALVRELFPDGNAIGKQIITPGWNGGVSATRTIVGVVGNERHRLGRPPRGEDYAPVSQIGPDMLSAVVRADTADPATVGKEIQAVYSSADPLLESPGTYTIATLIYDDSLEARSAATLLGALAVVALILALSGIFGVVSFSVSRRSREFGVRMALGARSHHVILDVLWRAMILTGMGVACGIILAAAGARVIASQLYSISPFDPLTFISVACVILGCAAIAALLPALRAIRVDPAVALRYE